MKQKELQKRINEFMTMLSNNGYSSHVIVAKDKKLALVGAGGDAEDIVNGFADMFNDAVSGESPQPLRILCSAISSIVLQHQQSAFDAILGLNDDENNEDCENCEKLNECMSRRAAETRKLKDVNVN